MRTYVDLSENQLCDLLKCGDHKAFDEIYERYSFQLLSHALRKCQDDEYAKDLLQEVFSTLWENRETIDIKKSLHGYLATSIRHSFLRKLKQEKVREKYITSFYIFVTTVANDTQSDHLIRKKQLQEIIEKEVMALPPRMREIFLKCRFQGMTHKQIAQELNISEKTVARQMSNAILILREKLPFFIFIILMDITK